MLEGRFEVKRPDLHLLTRTTMNDTPSNDTPREDWTLDQLGRFANRIAKRTAHDVWLLGRAFTIAKEKGVPVCWNLAGERWPGKIGLADK